LPKIDRQQYESLLAALQTHEFLRRMVDTLEHYHRLVFHANENVDWNLVRRSAEQILIAEIVTRHKGNFDGIYFALRAMENGGKPWNVAVQDLAGTIHSYFTTPLGIVMRKDLFGDDAVFITPEAYDWIRRHVGASGAQAATEA